MSDLSALKEYATRAAAELGHWLGPWHRIGKRGAWSGHEAECQTCHRRIQLIMDDCLEYWDVWGRPEMLAYSCGPVGGL